MTPTNFQRFVKELRNVTKNNKNLAMITNNHSAEIRYGPTTYVRYIPQNGKVWAWKGQTAPQLYRQGLGKRLREYGVRAAILSGVPLYHEGINVMGQVRERNMPVSTRIMRKLGAVPTGSSKLRFKTKKYSFLSVVPTHSKGTRSMTRKRNNIRKG